MRNLKELQAEKAKLKNRIEKGIDSPFSSFFDSIKKNENQNRLIVGKPKEERNQLMDEGVKALLSIITSSAVSRLKLGLLPKILITTGVAMITPFIVDKIQKVIRK